MFASDWLVDIVYKITDNKNVNKIPLELFPF